MKTLTTLITLLALNVVYADISPSMKKLLEASRPTLPQKALLELGDVFPQVVLETYTSQFTNVNVIEPESDGSPIQNESSIAINPLNPNYLLAAAVDYRDAGSAWVYVSSDAGKSWRNVNLGRVPDMPGFRVGNDPSVAWDHRGRGYVMNGGFNSSTQENGVFVNITTDNGVTWTKHVPVILHKGKMTRDSAFEDKYYIAVDNSSSSPYRGHLYTPWKRVYDRDSSTQIVVSKSTDAGLTWSEPVRVSDVLTGKSLDTTFGQSFPLVSTGPSGEVYTVWNHGPLHSIGFNKSTDGGKTWGSPRMIINYKWLGVAMFTGSQYNHTLKGGTRVESYPSLVVDTTSSPRKGTLYLTWAADPTPNIYFAKSTDGGANWSTPKIIHSDTSNDQFWQWTALDGSNGDIATMYMDSRDDVENKLARCYISYSSNGGDTWIDRATGDTSSDIRRNPFSTPNINGVFAGDYSGCAFYKGKIYPSHVDMRNTFSNPSDNDVYTEIINVSAPLPVDNFKAQTVLDSFRLIKLSWRAPTARSLGQSLNPSEFTYALYRDGGYLTSLPSTTLNYDDHVPKEFSRHQYSIVVVAGTDSSAARTVSGYAGGSPKPATARLVQVLNTNSNSATLRVHLPSLRADSVNALVNLAHIRIYRDSVFIAEKKVSATDTAKTVDLSDNVSEHGYYSYHVSAIDASGNESDGSNSVLAFVGKHITEFSERADGATLPRYVVGGGWQTTNELFYSSPNSLTESKGRQYRPQQRDTLTLFPVYATSNSGVLVVFRNAAITDRLDTCFVEASYCDAAGNDSGWTSIGFYNRTMYAAWQDSVLDGSDWRTEILKVNAIAGQFVKIRFRFRANITVQAEGWFIDDIAIGENVSGVDKESTAIEVLIYPNPASNELSILSESASTIQVSDMLGRIVAASDSEAKRTAYIDLSALPMGSYLVTVRSEFATRQYNLKLIR